MLELSQAFRYVTSLETRRTCAAQNDFLPFATGAGANVQDQPSWAGNPARANGFVGGLAKSIEANKAIRQPSFISAGIAEWVNEALVSVPILDDGNLAEWIANFDAALRRVFVAEAPNDGNTYGRHAGTWVPCLPLTAGPTVPLSGDLYAPNVRLTGNLFMGGNYVFFSGATSAGPNFYMDTANAYIRPGSGNGYLFFYDSAAASHASVNLATGDAGFNNINANAGINAGLNISAGQSLYCGNSLFVNGIQLYNSGGWLTGNVNLNLGSGSLSMGGNLNVTGNITSNNQVSGASLFTSGAANVQGNLNVTGNITSNNQVSGASLYTSGAAGVQGHLQVNGSANIVAGLTVDGFHDTGSAQIDNSGSIGSDGWAYVGFGSHFIGFGWNGHLNIYVDGSYVGDALFPNDIPTPMSNDIYINNPGDFAYGIPANARFCTISAWGGGGGGSGSDGGTNPSTQGASGAGGGFTAGTVGVTPGQNITGHVGEGGSGAVNGAQAGNGNTTVVNGAGFSYVAYGGAGASSGPGAGGGGGGGSFSIQGQGGTDLDGSSWPATGCAKGGDAAGGGGKGGIYNVGGVQYAPTAPGGGGGAAFNASQGQDGTQGGVRLQFWS
jgi:hypothetical protein